MRSVIELAERRLLPDVAVRLGIRRLLGRRLAVERERSGEPPTARVRAFVDEMTRGPIAVSTVAANEQHYELPAEFFQTVLGPYLKYSSCQWSGPDDDLAAAEERMLRTTCERAGIEDGMTVLDLGCGWGSATLWIARHYPRCRVVAVSNSSSQGSYIRGRCAREGLRNVSVMTADMNVFEPRLAFDRIVSVEMFEHMRNWPLLLGRVSRWLEPDGAMLLHVFCHRELSYRYEDEGSSDWMARHFFTGGIMPSDDLPYHASPSLRVDNHWRLGGLHYSRTLEAWLDRMDAAHERLAPVFARVYGHQARRWFARWRLFFMACSELFKYRGGTEWFVSHYLLRPIAATRPNQNPGSRGPRPGAATR